MKSAFICPRHPQQNYAEGYLGRVTAMASFAMVFSGAPLFMWIFGVRTAVFISNISASYYSKQQIWSTPYTLVHGESFPDASLVVPFGCAVLVLRDSNDRAKFRNRTVMMIFVHYSDDHPLFTYAVYSPRTKRVLHRQDVIFLTSVFPMRCARVAAGLGPDGDPLTVFRSPPSVLDGCPSDLSFGSWCAQDSLPDYDDDVSGFELSPPCQGLIDEQDELEGVPVHNPSHPSFSPSSVLVPIPAAPRLGNVGQPEGFLPNLGAELDKPDDGAVSPLSASAGENDGVLSLPDAQIHSLPVSDGSVALRRSTRQRPALRDAPVHRRPVGDRWSYEPVFPVGTALVVAAVQPTPSSGDGPSDPDISSGSSLPSPSPVMVSGSSAVPVTELPPPSPPPFTSVITADGPTGRFSINLLFPEGELPNQPFWVTTAMTVPTLMRSLADLMAVVTPLSLFVGPDWTPLHHDGLIVSRVLFDGITPCPYLQPGSNLRVVPYLQPGSINVFPASHVSSAVFGLASSRRFADSLPSPELDDSNRPLDPFGGASSFRLAPTVPLVFPSSGLVSSASSFGEDENVAFLQLQRNGEDHDGLERVSYGSQNAMVSRGVIVEEKQRQRDAVDAWNQSSVDEGLSPHELVYGTRVLSDGPCQDSGSRDDQFSSSSAPPLKRIRPSAGSSESDSSGKMGSDSGGKTQDSPVCPPVTRRERTALLQRFRVEQKFERRRVRLEVKATWDAEVAEDKENYRHEGDDAKEGSLLPRFPVDPEDAAEAYENYLFDSMLRHDRDASDLLLDFRSSLRVIPSWNVEEERINPALINSRTEALWEGLRRVYFGQREAEPLPQVEEQSHDEIMANLREEIASVDERLRLHDRSRLGRLPPESGRYLPPLPREDEDDEGDPSQPIAPIHVNPGPGSRGALVAIAPVPANPRHQGTSGPADVMLRSVDKLVFLTKRVLRRIMAAKESLFKFGTFVPKNDREAESSPESARWKAGRSLEWVRLGKEGTFDGEWTWDKVQQNYPKYKKSDIGFLFYIYDFKYSGEHRVRLVFDGSRQSEATYKETYAPTVRAESVRLFHIYCVEEGLQIGQYDVPQAFLKANIDHDIFVYPPRGQADFPGQILKLQKALYGGKQSAFLWFTMMNSFLLSLGFSSSPLDSCFYKRSDAVLILYCDDLRIGASPDVLASLHASLSEKFSVTTAPGDRFLGMDTHYDSNLGVLKLSMKTYVETTMERFKNFDLSQGYPYRELVGCLLWITLSVMGPELLRVKDLARLSNCFGEVEYTAALKVLKRIYVRRYHGIVVYRHAAGKEIVPSSERLHSPALSMKDSGESDPLDQLTDDIGTHIAIADNEVTTNSLCKGKALFVGVNLNYKVEDSEHLDLPRVQLPVNLRYSLLGYGDASFAVGETKQSVTGLIVYVNGVPLLWGSLKQTVVVDSSSSAEFVAASVTCKQLLHAENMLGFLGFSAPKPYRLYTDSKACFHIASNASKLGNVRHLQIRYHMVRCYVSLGDIEMCFCITEEMLADLLTKIVVGAQDHRLSLQFYSLVPGSSYLVSGTTTGLNAVD